MMRPSCYNCARKHLAQADILMMEAAQGYPLHVWYAMGHMAEAADELVATEPEMANVIREHRKMYEGAVTEGITLNVPIMELIAKITMLADAADARSSDDASGSTSAAPKLDDSDGSLMFGERQL
jgi:hypothetical protein